MKIILIVLFAAVLAACGDGSDGDDAATPTATEAEAGEAAGPTGAGLCEPAGNQMEVDPSCFEEEWPLTVDSGVLVCENDSVVFDTGEAIFAVNREAELRGVQPIAAIQAEGDDEGGTGGADVEPLIRTGLTLCDE